MEKAAPTTKDKLIPESVADKPATAAKGTVMSAKYRPCVPKEPAKTTVSVSNKPKAPAPKKLRRLFSSSSSSSSNEDLPPKKGRASGTMLKDLLTYGSRILLQAASKVDQLAPAVTVSTSPEVKENLQHLQQIVKLYHEENVKLYKANEAKLDRLGSKMDHLTARFDQMERELKDYVKAIEPKISDENIIGQRQELNDELKKLCKELSTFYFNVPQLSGDIRAIHSSFDELKQRFLDSDMTQPSPPTEPGIALDKVHCQMDQTKRELQRVRQQAQEVNREIERKWQSGRSRTALDDLKEKRRRSQKQELKLEEEMRSLQHNLEREIAGELKEAGSSRGREGRDGRESLRRCSSHGSRDRDRRGDERGESRQRRSSHGSRSRNHGRRE